MARVTRLMISSATLNAALFLVLTTAVARADQTLGTFGGWTTTSGTTENQPSCAISSPIADGSPALALSANLATPTVFNLAVSRPNWSFTSGSIQTVALTFDGKGQTLTGNGDGNRISVTLDTTTFRPFLHGFTGGQSLSISASGDTEPAVFGLGGTTAAVTALGQCTVADGFTQLPPPFAPATPTTEAAAKASVQAVTTAAKATASTSANTPSGPSPVVTSTMFPAADTTTECQTFNSALTLYNDPSVPDEVHAQASQTLMSEYHAVKNYIANWDSARISRGCSPRDQSAFETDSKQDIDSTMDTMQRMCSGEPSETMDFVARSIYDEYGSIDRLGYGNGGAENCP